MPQQLDMLAGEHELAAAALRKAAALRVRDAGQRRGRARRNRSARAERVGRAYLSALRAFLDGAGAEVREDCTP